MTEPLVEVLGASESAADAALNEIPIDMGDDGSFIVQTLLVSGPNILTPRAIDPAGNQSTVAQIVIYRPAEQVRISLSSALPRVGGALATRSGEFSVFAASTATTGAEVLIMV